MAFAAERQYSRRPYHFSAQTLARSHRLSPMKSRLQVVRQQVTDGEVVVYLIFLDTYMLNEVYK